LKATYTVKGTNFEKNLIDYTDSLSNFTYKHNIEKNELIKEIVNLSLANLNIEQVAVEFDEMIENNIISDNRDNLWVWKFSLPEWDVTYQFVTREEFIFQRVLDPSELQQIINTRKSRIDEILSHKIFDLSPEQCEIFVGKLFGNFPQVSDLLVTPPSNDGGIDFKGKWKVEGISEKHNLLGQVKRYTKTKIGGPDIQTFLGTLTAFQPSNTIGIFVSTSGFNRNATDMAKKAQYNIELYDMSRLIDAIHKTSTGTNLLEIELKDIDELFWDSLND